MRWDRFFDDLEDQLASEWEAERAALDSEAERLRLSRVPLRDRLAGLIEREGTSTPPSFEMRDGTVLVAEVSGLGADWVALDPAQARSGAVIAPLTAIMSIGMPHPDLLRSARPIGSRSSLSERMTLGFALRDLVRRRVAVSIHLVHGRTLTGTIDRAGVDHLDLALHEPGTPRRTDEVSGHRIVPFDAIAWVRLEAGATTR
ncbi:hypothetical protein G5T42_01260 [Microbacterium sp. 4R-513]|uniref:hypothetical protein n=1 Tax=Microbacterium sp. 4R-513 TaxID=2567934 RepID=UPI0013E1CE62|nr:hypothetical protein [Microbacterium sp. 4R-513]QIG38273.1 hypothetical protein G5T42_01260 [Microbacterium sp. 4R-513]